MAAGYTRLLFRKTNRHLSRRSGGGGGGTPRRGSSESRDVAGASASKFRRLIPAGSETAPPAGLPGSFAGAGTRLTTHLIASEAAPPTQARAQERRPLSGFSRPTAPTDLAASLLFNQRTPTPLRLRTGNAKIRSERKQTRTRAEALTNHNDFYFSGGFSAFPRHHEAPKHLG